MHTFLKPIWDISQKAIFIINFENKLMILHDQIMIFYYYTAKKSRRGRRYISSTMASAIPLSTISILWSSVKTKARFGKTSSWPNASSTMHTGDTFTAPIFGEQQVSKKLITSKNTTVNSLHTSSNGNHPGSQDFPKPSWMPIRTVQRRSLLKKITMPSSGP